LSSNYQTPAKGKYLYALALGALGVVYGDIGTSPLYAFKECFGVHYGLQRTPANILGVLSLIFWALVLIISIKYLLFVMRADNRGEGGIMALTALLLQRASFGRSRRAVLLVLGLFGAALLYGDGVITPAISVISAIEGLNEITPVLQPYVIPITIVILIGLFGLQRRGTGGIGVVFGPVVTVWFVTLAILGIRQIVHAPGVLLAVNPWHGVSFFLRNGWGGFLVLGSVFLVVTGGEALYADMGHFGKRPIRLAWFAVALPGLLLNYFGQGALLISAPSSQRIHPFFDLAPKWALLPLVMLATAAAVIASQAVISGAFSLTRQAIQLGYSPRMEIDHTSEREIGQIYMPSINWALMLATLLLVLTFRSSSGLAAMYGVAVTTTMVITTILFYVVARERWHWSLWHTLLLAGAFLIMDLGFFGANILKLRKGGWVPLLLALFVYLLMDTWKKGREMLADRLRERSMPIDLFLEDIARHPERRVPGNAVFMTGTATGIPPGLLHNMKHNRIVHSRVVLLTVVTEEVPHVDASTRIDLEELGHGFYRAIAHYGFMQDPDMNDILAELKPRGLDMHTMDTSFYLGRDTLLTTDRPGLSRWRKRLFDFLSRNARSATAFFGIPPNRVVELGAQIEI
jgi:KUP system potassium uptake protein